jgi:predicted DNA-binding protein
VVNRKVILLASLVSFGLLSQYCPDFSQQKAGRVSTDVVVINEKSFDPNTLKKDLEEKKEDLISEKDLPKNLKKDETNQNKTNRDSNSQSKDNFKSIVIGKNIKVGMSLQKAIKILGIPKSLKVKRGIEPKLDSMSIKYLDHGITIHVQNGKRRVESMEISQKFKGEFAKGIKIGEKVSVLIDKLGIPQSIDPSIARYPKKGIHFTLKKSSLVGAYVFKK